MPRTLDPETAIGADLDLLGRMHRVEPRSDGEPDDDLRERVIAAASAGFCTTCYAGEDCGWHRPRRSKHAEYDGRAEDLDVVTREAVRGARAAASAHLALCAISTALVCVMLAAARDAPPIYGNYYTMLSQCARWSTITAPTVTIDVRALLRACGRSV